MGFRKNIGKALLVLLITIIGGVITCGGNFMLTVVFNFRENSYNALAFLWFIELGVSFIFAVWFIFFRKKKNADTPAEEKGS